ncbi:unnamed protein product [Chilo suppressalis]|uniref:Jumonji domain-containing protein 4 n=1 Tax=Chilo suppressalis TaxID=168631 RepID=A0ABN8B691_CHISP|nr:hypothetical protein evm_006598 [Chilo suppressalis]CAH0404945.1 unnamed protein product [Chilo suppressalis]
MTELDIRLSSLPNSTNEFDYEKFTIKSISDNWECTRKWVKDDTIHYDYLTNAYGDLEAPIADCNNVAYNAHCKTIMKVSNYMEYLKQNNEQLLYLKDWHLKRLQPNDNFYETPMLFASDWLNEFCQDLQEDDFMFVYIGPKNSWTPLHADVYSSYSWSVNVVGRKQWILFPPGEEEKLKDKLVEQEIQEFKHSDDFTAQCQLILKSIFGMDFKMFVRFICHIADKIVNLNHSQIPLNTHKKFHQNRSSRLREVQ